MSVNISMNPGAGGVGGYEVPEAADQIPYEYTHTQVELVPDGARIDWLVERTEVILLTA